jgi:probable HAF family extracellular repeat protein
MSSPCLFVRAPEQVSVHPRILTISPSKADRLFAPRRRVLMQSRRTFAFWLFLFCLISPLAVTQVYKVTDLGPLAPTAINNWGQVVGNLNGHAFIWTQWGSLDLGTLAGGTFSRAAAINDFAVVTGTADGPGTVISTSPFFQNQECSDLTQPFVWTPKNGMGGLGTITISPGWFDFFACDVQFYATDINALDQVVGYTSVFGGSYQYNFLWTKTGAMTSFMGPDGGNYPPTFANAISNRGQIVGQSSSVFLYGVGHATSWNNGIEMDLGTLGGGQDVVDYGSSANAVNDLGQAVGWSTTGPVSYFNLDSPVHAVLWTPNGEIRDLGTLPGDTLSAASGINIFGQVIGSSGNTAISPTEVTGHPFIWTQRSGMKDLNTLISAKSGWVLNSATGVNFWGQIVGSGTRHGKPHGFLLTPKF